MGRSDGNAGVRALPCLLSQYAGAFDMHPSAQSAPSPHMRNRTQWCSPHHHLSEPSSVVSLFPACMCTTLGQAQRRASARHTGHAQGHGLMAAMLSLRVNSTRRSQCYQWPAVLTAYFCRQISAMLPPSNTWLGPESLASTRGTISRRFVSEHARAQDHRNRYERRVGYMSRYYILSRLCAKFVSETSSVFRASIDHHRKCHRRRERGTRPENDMLK